ncbi:hypothetical protein ACO2Q3_25380 [Caulobacter sp. KR2-114]|uniref:hypothetical protein n=1 Tax=Caulobacter sp. KR2-114 TaxID=3400912 RepID=UPI003C0D33DA
MLQQQPKAPHPAIVARFEGGGAHEKYLRLEPSGGVVWEDDSARATSFGSLTEASRAAFRLPAVWRAFGVPMIPDHLSHAA